MRRTLLLLSACALASACSKAPAPTNVPSVEPARAAEPIPAAEPAVPPGAAPTPTPTRDSAIAALQALVERAGRNDPGAYAQLVGGKRGVLVLDEDVCESRVRLAGEIDRFECNDDLSQCSALQDAYEGRYTFVFEAAPAGSRRLLGSAFYDTKGAPTWLEPAAIAAATAARDVRCELVDAMLNRPKALVPDAVWTYAAAAKTAADVHARCGAEAADAVLPYVEDPYCLACDGLTCASGPGCSGRTEARLQARRVGGALRILSIGAVSAEDEQAEPTAAVRERLSELPGCPGVP